MNYKKALVIMLLIAVFMVGAFGVVSASSTSGNSKVTKATLKVSAPSVTNTYKKSQTFKVTVKNKKTGKSMKNVKVNIKVYTGKKYKTYNKKTNKKGITSINTKKLSKGKHKVIIKIKSTKKYKAKKSKSTIKITSSKKTETQANTGNQTSNKAKVKTHFEFNGMSFNRAPNGRLESVTINLDLVDEKGKVLKKPIIGQMYIYYFGSIETYGPEASGTSGSDLKIFRDIGSWSTFVQVDFKGDKAYEPATYRRDISI